MPKFKNINELLTTPGKRLGALKARTEERRRALLQVCAALPEALAGSVVSAGLESGRLTIGVHGASWAARLRYQSDALRAKVGAAMGTEIESVRIKVVPPVR